MAQFILFGGPGFVIALVLGFLLGRHRRPLVIASVVVLAILGTQLVLVLREEDPAESQVPLTILFVGANALGWVLGAVGGSAVRRLRRS